MTEIISTPHALVQTTNGKRFYAFSGEIAISNVETDMIAVDNVGERDFKLHLEFGHLLPTSVDVVARIRINGTVVWSFTWADTGYGGGGMWHSDFIIPANVALIVSLQSGSGTPTWVIAGSGKYLSMD